MDLKMLAPCHFGLEKTLSFEIKRAGATDIEVTDGRVSFCGDEKTLASANISCSVAERVGIILAEFKAETFDDVFDNVKKIPLFHFAGKNDRFPVVKGQSINSKLTSIPALQRTVKKALVESMAAHYKVQSLDETGVLFPVRFFLIRDKMTVFLDSSGEGLHKRGYRANSAEAPIKETLAAGLIDIARVKRDSIVADPFCGSGTILIEAAFKALNIPPCLNRSFAAEQWSVIPQEIWREARRELEEKIIKESGFCAYGFDKDGRCVKLTCENAWKAGVSSYVKAEKRDISGFKYEWEKVKIITNPPYAKRLLEQDEAEEVYKTMGRVMLPTGENELYIINSNETFETHFGQKAKKNRKLYNGMLLCRLYMYSNY